MSATEDRAIWSERTEDRSGAWTSRVLVFLLFTLLSIFMTYPLILHLRTRIPGPPGDNFAWLYHMWWLRGGVIDLGAWLSANPAVFYPFGYHLSLSQIMLANQAHISPFLLVGGEVLGYNALLLLSFVLSGYTTYLLIAYLTDNRCAAVVGGALFAFCPYRMHAMAAGWLPLIATQWIPLVFLYLERTLREHKARYALCAGLFLGLNALASWNYASIVGALAIVYLLVRTRPWRSAFRGTYLARNLFLIVTIALALIGPVAWERASLGVEGAQWVPVDAREWTPSVTDFFLPSVYHPLWDRVLERDAITLQHPWDAPGYAYLGGVAVFLAVLGLLFGPRTGRIRRAYVWMGAISLVLALGAFLYWKGEAVEITLPPRLASLRSAFVSLWNQWAARRGVLADLPLRPDAIPIPLPGLLLYLWVPLHTAIPLLRGLGTFAAFTVSVLAGVGAAQILGGSRVPIGPEFPVGGYSEDGEGADQGRTTLVAPLLTPLLVGAVLFDFFSMPLAFGMSAVEIQPLDLWLAAQSGETVVMQYPLTRALSGISLYHLKYHGKRIAYGYGELMPQSYGDAMPVLGSFPSEESLELLRSWGVTHVVVASRAYDVGGEEYLNTPVSSWEEMRVRIEAASGLEWVGVTREDPIWADTHTPYATLEGPLRVFLQDEQVYVYELH